MSIPDVQCLTARGQTSDEHSGCAMPDGPGPDCPYPEMEAGRLKD